MDELDKKILKELQLDSRNSFTKIAQRIGVSTATVSERVKRLTEKGIICGYTTVLNTSELGMVTLITKIKTKPGYNSIEEVGEAVAGMAETCCVHQVTGDCDLIVISKCVGYDKCGIILEKIKEIEGVESMDAELVLKTLKEELKVEL
ncbi:MAG: Lrp/AsnC family transcriptional regulator [Methanophagales archaeon]|nr:Lrp/AsnC family transcriptional regulator [Methanophagales archaeon]MCW3141109.1 Lrp/AsnC family transcriptional regulator [Methanophagales archaeon]